MTTARQPWRTRSLAAAAIATGLLLTACSGSSGTTTSAGSSSTSAATAPPATGPVVGPTAPTTTERIRKGGPVSTLAPQLDQVLNAVTGTWKGDAGTLTFANDGTATFVLRDCPLQPGGPSFGYSTTCEPRTVRGRVSVGDFTLLLSDESGAPPIAFGIYVDAEGRLHLGSGGAFPTTPTLQTRILLGLEPAEGVIGVDGDQCALDPNPSTRVVRCQWTTREGQQVLLVDDQVWVYEKDLDLIASPQAHFQTFTR